MDLNNLSQSSFENTNDSNELEKSLLVTADKKVDFDYQENLYKTFGIDEDQSDKLAEEFTNSLAALAPKVNNATLGITNNEVTRKGAVNQNKLNAFTNYLDTPGYNQEGPEQTYIPDVQFGSSKLTGYDRIAEHHNFKDLGWSPIRDNEEYYNANTSAFWDFTRAIPHFINSAGSGFMSGYRSIGDWFDGDNYWLSADDETAYEFEEATRLGSSTRGGLSGFGTNLFLQFGYTAGILGSIAAESMVLAAAEAVTFGGATPLVAARAGVNSLRLGKGLRKMYNVFKPSALKGGAQSILNNIRNIDSATDFWVAARGVGAATIKAPVNAATKIFTPQTVELIKAFRTSDKAFKDLSNLAKTAKTFGAFYKDLRAINFAMSESKLEAGFSYNQVYSDGYAEQLKLNKGEALTEAQIANVNDKALEAASTTIMLNAPILFATNQLVLGTALRGFSPTLRRVFAEQSTGFGKNILRSKPVLNKATGKLNKGLYVDVTPANWRANFLNLKKLKALGTKGYLTNKAHGLLRYSAASLGEGVQEVYQEGVQVGVADYYKTLMSSTAAPPLDLLEQSIYKGAASQMTGQGFETFLSGFLMGGLAQGPQKLFFEMVPQMYQKRRNPEKFAEYEKRKTEFVKWANEVGDDIQDNPFDYFNESKLAFFAAKEGSEETKKHLFSDDVFGFRDSKDDTLFNYFHFLMTSEADGLYIEQLEDLLKLDDEKLNELYKDEEKSKTNVREKIEKSINDIKSYKKEYKKSFDVIVNDVDYEQYEKGSVKYNNARAKYNAIEHARMLYLFANNSFNKALKRRDSIEASLKTAFPAMDKLTADDFTVLLSTDSINKEISILELEIDNLEKAENKDKELIDKKKSKAEALLKYRISLEFTYDKESDVYDREKIDVLRKPLLEYVKSVPGNESLHVNNSELNKVLQMLLDHNNLDKRAQVLDRTISLFSNPAKVTDIIDRMSNEFKTLYKESGEIFKKNIKKQVLNAETEEYLNQLEALNVYPANEEELVAFLKTGDVSLITEYRSALGIVNAEIGGELFNKIQDLISVYNLSSNKTEEIKKETKEEKTEEKKPSSVKNEIDEKVDEIAPDDIKEALEEAPETNITLDDQSPFAQQVLLAIYARNKLASWNSGQYLTLEEWMSSAEGAAKTNGIEKIKKIWYTSLDKENLSEEELKNTYNNDLGFQEWVTSQQNNEVINLILAISGLSINDFKPGIESTEEIGQAEDVQDKKFDFVISNPKTNLNILKREAPTSAEGETITLYTITDLKGNQLSDDELKRFGIEEANYSNIDKAKDAYNTILKQQSAVQESLKYDGVDLKYLDEIENVNGQRYIVLGGVPSAKGKILLKVTPITEENKTKEERENDSIILEEKDFSKLYTKVEVSFKGVTFTENMSKLDPSQVSQVYPNFYPEDYKKENNKEIVNQRFAKTLEMLTPEQLSSATIVITKNERREPKKLKLNNAPENTFINDKGDKYTISILLDPATTTSIKNAFKDTIYEYPKSFRGNIGYIKNDFYSFNGVKNKTINLSTIEDGKIERYIVPEYSTASDLKNAILKDEKFVSAIDKLMGDNNSLNFSYGNFSKATEFTIEMSNGQFKQGSEKISFRDLDYNTFDGKVVIMVNTKQADGALGLSYITNATGAEELALIENVKTQLKKDLTSQRESNMFNEARTLGRYVGVIKSPNGTITLAQLSQDSISEVVLTDLYKELLEQAKKVKNGNVEKKDVYSWNNNFNSKFYTALNPNIESPFLDLNVDLKGNITLSFSAEGISVEEKILAADLAEYENDINKISELFERLNNNVKVIEFNKGPNKLNFSEKNLLQVFPIDASIDEVLDKTKTDLDKRVRFNHKIYMDTTQELSPAETLTSISVDNPKADDYSNTEVESESAQQTTTDIEAKKAEIKRRRQEKRGEALISIGVDEFGFDKLQREDWRKAKNYDLKRAIDIAQNQLNANPNSKLGSIPQNPANAIIAELQIAGIKATDETFLSEILGELKEINAKYDAELDALESTQQTSGVLKTPSELGISNTPLYHGTTYKIDKIDPLFRQKNKAKGNKTKTSLSGSSESGIGIYLSPQLGFDPNNPTFTKEGKLIKTAVGENAMKWTTDNRPENEYTGYIYEIKLKPNAKILEENTRIFDTNGKEINYNIREITKEVYDKLRAVGVDAIYSKGETVLINENAVEELILDYKTPQSFEVFEFDDFSGKPINSKSFKTKEEAQKYLKEQVGNKSIEPTGSWRQDKSVDIISGNNKSFGFKATKGNLEKQDRAQSTKQTSGVETTTAITELTLDEKIKEAEKVLEKEKALIEAEWSKTKQNRRKLKKESASYQDAFKNLKDLMQERNDLNAFKILDENESDFEIENLNEFINWAQENLPSFITIENLDSIKTRLKANGITVGQFSMRLKQLAGGVKVEGAIYTGEKSPFKYHEAFHAVFRLLLTTEEQNKLLKLAKNEVRKKFKTTKALNQELDRFKVKHPKYKAMSASELEKEYLEEYMADEFDKFKMNPRSTKTSSVIKSFFNRLLEWIKGVFKYKQNNLTNFFKEVNAGKFKNTGIQDNTFTRSLVKDVAIDAYKIIPYEVVAGEKMTSAKYLDPSTSNVLIKMIGYTFTERQQGSTEEDDLLLGTIIDEYADLYNPEQERYNNKSEKDFEKLENVYDALTLLDGEAVMDGVKQYLDLINVKYENTQDELDEIEDAVGSRKVTDYNKDANQFGGYASASKTVKMFIASVALDSSDMFGNTELLDGTKIKVPVNHIDVYNGLMLAGVHKTNTNEILEGMYIFSRRNKNTRAVIDAFFEKTGIKINNENLSIEIPKEIKNSQLFNQFIKTFKNARFDYLFMLEENITDVSIISAANRDAANSQIDNWKKKYGDLFESFSTNQNNLDNAISAVTELNQLLSSTSITNKELIAKAKLLSKNLSNDLGIDLSPLYLEVSIASLLNEKGKTKYQKMLTSLGKNKRLLTSEDATILLDKISAEKILEKGKSKKTIPAPENLFIDDEGKGMSSKLKAIALGNAFFDETVGNTVFLNPNKDLVYAHQKQTYHSRKINSLNNAAEYKKLQRKYPSNILLNNPAFKQMSEDKQHELLRLAGSNVASKKDSTSSEGFEFSTSNGQTFGDFKTVDFIRHIVNLYVAKYNTLSNKNETIKVENEEGSYETAVAPVLIRIMESADTADFVPLPVIKTVTNGEITNEAVNAFVDIVEKEYNKIKENFEKGLGDIVNYNDSYEKNGFKFFKAASLITQDLQDKLIEDAKKDLKWGDVSQNVFSNVKTNLEEITDSFMRSKYGFLNFSDLVNGKFPEGVAAEKSMAELNLLRDNFDHNIKQILLNNFLNTLAINEITLGEEARLFKDTVIDPIKRAKMQNGAHDSVDFDVLPEDPQNKLRIKHTMGEGSIALITVTDDTFEQKFTNGVRVGNNDGESTDAQSYTITKGARYFNYGIGELSNSLAELLNKIDDNEKVTSEDFFGKDGHLKSNATLNSQKYVYGDGETFVKTSTTFLTAAETSNLVNGKLIPKAGMEKLHYLRENMEAFAKNNPGIIPIVAPVSAVKMFKQNVIDIIDMTNGDRNITIDDVTLLNAKDFGRQMVNPSNKMEITKVNQMKTLITSEQYLKDDFKVVIAGEELSIKDVIAEYHKMTSAGIRFDFNQKVYSIFDVLRGKDPKIVKELLTSGNLDADLSLFIETAQSNAKASAAGSNIIEFFSADDNGQPNYELNNTLTSPKFEQFFLAYFSKKILAQKIAGHAFTLRSSFGTSVIRKVYSVDSKGNLDKQKVIRRNVWERKKNQEITIDLRKEDGFEKLNEALKTNSDGVVVIDRLRIGLPEYVKTGNPENWVFTNKRYGETIVAPHHKEVMDWAENTGGEIPDAIADMFIVRVPSQDKHSAMNIKIVDFSPVYLGSTAMFADELVEISGADFDVDKVYASIKEWRYINNKFIEYGSRKGEEGFDDYVNYVNKKIKVKGSYLNDALKQFKSRGVEDKITETDIIELEKLGYSDDAINALRVLKLPITFVEFNNYIKKEGVAPYTAPISNKILDYQLALVGNTKLTESETGAPIAYQPADVAALKDEWDKLSTEFPLLKELNSEVNIAIDSLLGQAFTHKNVKENSKLIGSVVPMNVILNFLKENNIELRKEFGDFRIDGVSYSKLYDYENNNETLNRVQYLLSNLITAATDDAKERLLSKLGYIKPAIKNVETMVAFGISLHTATKIVNAEVIKDILEQTNYGSELRFRIRELKLEGAKNIAITTKLINKAVETSDLSINEELSLLTLFNKINTVTGFSSKMISIFNLNTGFGKDFSTLMGREKDINALGLYASDKEFKSLKYNKQALPFDVRKAFTSSGHYINEYLKINNEFTNLILPQLFITQTSDFKKIFNSVSSYIDYFKNEDLIYKTHQNVLAYVTIKAYINQLFKTEAGAAVGGSLSNAFVYPQSGSNFTINKVIDDLRKKYKNKDNYFLKYYLFNQKASAENNKTGMNIITTNSFGKNNDNEKVRIQNGFQTLYGERETRIDAIHILHYAMVKDGLQFDYGSILDAITPFGMENYLNASKNAFEAFKGNKSFEDVFGLSKDEFYIDFVSNYGESSKISYSLSGLNNQIKNSYKATKINNNIKWTLKGSSSSEFFPRFYKFEDRDTGIRTFYKIKEATINGKDELTKSKEPRIRATEVVYESFKPKGSFSQNPIAFIFDNEDFSRPFLADMQEKNDFFSESFEALADDDFSNFESLEDNFDDFEVDYEYPEETKNKLNYLNTQNIEADENNVTINNKNIADYIESEETLEPAPQTSGVRSIPMQPDNVSKILSGEKTTTLRTNNLPSGVYNIGGQQFNLTNRGLLSIEEAGGVEAISKSEAFAQSGPKFSSTKDFLAGKRKLYVYDITPTQPTQQPSEVKEGVSELFESNPKLANEVYEGLGFGTLISHFTTPAKAKQIRKQGYIVNKPAIFTVSSSQETTKGVRKSFMPDVMYFTKDNERWAEAKNIFIGENKGNEDFTYYDYTGNQGWITLKNAAKSIKLEPINYLLNKDSKILTINSISSLQIEGKNARNYFTKKLGKKEFNFIDDFIPYMQQIYGEDFFTDSSIVMLAQYAKENNYDGLNIKDENGWQSEKPDKYGNKNLYNSYTGNSGKNDFFIFNNEVVNQITPQQNQEAQKLYSQYLDTIFPDSKVKDIVYHVGYNIIEKFTKRDNGIYFTDNIKYAENLIVGKIKSDASYSGVTMTTEEAKQELKRYSVVLNSKNIKEIPIVNSEIVKKLNKGNFDTIKGIEDKSKNVESYVVFEPEQIHILGSKQDIEGFKEFVNKPTQQTGEVGSIENVQLVLDFNELDNAETTTSLESRQNNPLINELKGSDETLIEDFYNEFLFKNNERKEALRKANIGTTVKSLVKSFEKSKFTAEEFIDNIKKCYLNIK